MINQVFGEWDAPVTDDAERIEAPVGRTCLWCGEEIKVGDNGRIYSLLDDLPREPYSQHEALHGWTEHKECSLRCTLGGIGHLVDHERYCRSDLGPDAGLTRRESSLLVYEFFVETRFDPTAEQLERWRDRLNALRSNNQQPDNNDNSEH